MARYVSLDNILEMDIYIDASHAVHPDMKGHTGGCTSTGTGVIHSRSSKQRINTKSSTESELVGASEYMPFAIWILYFLSEQGYSMKIKTLKQDNMSTIKMLNNGIKSAGQKSRHINIRFFWTADRLKSEKIMVEYCPTEIMLGDFFTKPLQGRLFNEMRSIVMGHKNWSEVDQQYLRQSQLAGCRKERVGKSYILEKSGKGESNKKNMKVRFGDCPANDHIGNNRNGGKHVIEQENINGYSNDLGNPLNMN